MPSASRSDAARQQPAGVSAAAWLAGSPLSARGWQAVVGQLRRALARRFAAVDAARLDLLAWAARFLPQHFAVAPSRMHVELARQLDTWSAPGARGQRLNVIAPRGSAKSTLVTLAYVLREACEAREPYLWIVSETRAQALAHIENLRHELAHNRALRRAYPLAARTPAARFRGGHRLRLANGAAVDGFGVGQRIRGLRWHQHRPTLIVCDDLQSDASVWSEVQREHLAHWFDSNLMKAGAPHTNVIHLGTALHRACLSLALARAPGWSSRTYRAIEGWPTAMQLWEQWETLYRPAPHDNAHADTAAAVSGDDSLPPTIDAAELSSDALDAHGTTGPAAAWHFFQAHRAAMEAGAQLLWPARFDLYTLMRMRVEQGPAAFEREMQGAPFDPTRSEWRESCFDAHAWFAEWPRRLRLKTLALDPSLGRDDARGDYSAYVLLGIDAEGVLYVEADLARRATAELVQRGVELHERFAPDAFALEANQFQHLLGPLFAAEFQRQGRAAVGIWTLDNRVPKGARIRRLGPWLVGGRVRFKTDSPGTQLLVRQLREFPLADHDDGPDALEMALRLAQELEAGARVPTERSSRLTLPP